MNSASDLEPDFSMGELWSLRNGGGGGGWGQGFLKLLGGGEEGGSIRSSKEPSYSFRQQP